jgi:hypothetical protein
MDQRKKKKTADWSKIQRECCDDFSRSECFYLWYLPNQIIEVSVSNRNTCLDKETSRWRKRDAAPGTVTAAQMVIYGPNVIPGILGVVFVETAQRTSKLTLDQIPTCLDAAAHAEGARGSDMDNISYRLNYAKRFALRTERRLPDATLSAGGSKVHHGADQLVVSGRVAATSDDSGQNRADCGARQGAIDRAEIFP